MYPVLYLDIKLEWGPSIGIDIATLLRAPLNVEIPIVYTLYEYWVQLFIWQGGGIYVFLFQFIKQDRGAQIETFRENNCF